STPPGAATPPRCWAISNGPTAHPDLPGALRAHLDRDGGDEDGLGARQPALRVGLPRELGWAATFLASPYAGFVSGHSLVVDGANWQRRSLVAPPVVPVREQLGRGPFTLPGEA
ncbi:SDR family oxidoreductase, partial [Streptomyces sp. NPDC001478]